MLRAVAAGQDHEPTVVRAPRADAAQRRIAIGYVLLCLAVNALFFLVPHPPLLDVPNHAARSFLICQAGDPVLSQMYAIRFGLIPNLATDLLTVPLCRVVSAFALQILFLTGAQLVIAACVFVLHRHWFGSLSPSLLIAPALSLNLVSMMGYVNYLVGAAVAFLLFTVLVLAREDQRRTRLILVGTIGGTVLFFSHVFALLLMLVLATGWAWKDLFPKQTIATLARAGLTVTLSFAVPLFLMLFVERSGGAGSISWEGKLRVLIAPFYTGEQRSMVFINLLLFGGALLLALRGRLRSAEPAKWPLLLLGVTVAVIPGEIGDAVDIDARLTVPFVWLAVAGTRFVDVPVGMRRMGWGLAAGVYGAIAVAVVTVWLPFSRQVDELTAAMARIPAGASIVTVYADKTSLKPARAGAFDVPYWHLTSYAVAERRAFNPLLFSAPGMQPLRFVGRYRALGAQIGQPLPDTEAPAYCHARRPQSPSSSDTHALGYAIGWCDRFDTVLYLHLGAPRRLGPVRLEDGVEGSFFTLARIGRPPVFRPS